MLRGGAIIQVTSLDQAKTAECRVGHFVEAQILESVGKFGFLVIWMRMRFLLLRRRAIVEAVRNAIVEAVRNYNDARILAKVSSGLSDMGASGMELNEVNELNDAMNGVNIDENENNEGSYYILAFSIIYCCRMLMKMV
ncbi:pyridoxal 5'-phosphate synthase-like subunit PDX1.2 [Tanacetum coccineum]